MRDHVVPDGDERPIFLCAERYALLGLRAAADRPEHLRPRKRELHRTSCALRRQRGEHHMRPRRAFAAEAAADEGRDDPHALGRDAERLRHRFTHARDVLRRVVEREPLALPRRDRRVRLHRVVRLHRRGIGLLDAHFSATKRLVRIAPRHRRLALRHLLHRISVTLCALEVELRPLLAVAHLHDVGRSRGVLECIGDDQRNRLAVVVHDVVLQERERAPRGRLDRRLATLWQLRRVEVRDYEQHARRLLRPARIERDDGAFGDRALHDHGVRETRQLKLRRVARLAGDLERPIGAIHGLGDDAHAMPPAVCTARTMARCASSTLNALSR